MGKLLTFVLLILQAGVATPAGLAAEKNADDQRAVQWQRWEGTLTARREHPQPYTGVEVDVTFTGPEGATLHVPAYWDGGTTYRFGAAFPRVGAWRWTSACNDPADAGLHGRAGAVEVSAYSGSNPLYRHGDLKVSADRRYLVHADGTPFLWMGDTGWHAAWKGTAAEWREYVETRARQRFSVIQLFATGMKDVGKLPGTGQAPYLPDGAPNPPFWRDLAEKIACANEQGMIILLAGVGKNKNERFDGPQQNPAFPRYLAGRFASLFVIFSPSMDHTYQPKNDEVGTALRRLTTHLITQHPATDFEAAKKYHDADYADFCGLQSGHHGGKLPQAYNAARTWTLELWNRPPVKPVINIEAMYDAYGHNNAKNWRERDARKLGWISWLAGSRGYTYGAGDVPPKVPGGAGGIWRLSENPAAFDYWRKALAWPSAAQMTILRDFFGGIEWWTLEPAPEMVKNQAEEETRKMVASRSRSGKMVVAYLPDNERIELELKGLPAPTGGMWFDPVSGHSLALDKPAMSGTVVSLNRPAGWEDAVLVLQAK